jgi:hypothetical protein
MRCSSALLIRRSINTFGRLIKANNASCDYRTHWLLKLTGQVGSDDLCELTRQYLTTETPAQWFGELGRQYLIKLKPCVVGKAHRRGKAEGKGSNDNQSRLA